MLDLEVLRRDLSTSPGRVSSSRMLVPWVGESPKAQTDRAESRSQSYLDWKYRPTFLLSQVFSLILPDSNCSERPSSSGSAIMVNLFRLLAVSAKHLIPLVSTTVSRNATTGSAT